MIKIFTLTENLATSNLDFEFHTVVRIQKLTMCNLKRCAKQNKLDVVHAVPPRYRATYFSHIFAEVMPRLLFIFMDEMLDQDARNWFENPEIRP